VVISIPWIVEAATRMKDTCQAKYATMAVIIKTIGMAIFAAILKPTSSTPALKRGKAAINACIPDSITFPF
jgi:hypothetical protein